MPSTFLLNLILIPSDSLKIADDRPHPLKSFALLYNFLSLKHTLPPEPAPVIMCDA